MNQQGSWGVSHTRMPTESRPGHVALTAGLYEDPSALFKGWKSNPVDFDSVFNQSRMTWAWGSPDIIPMFVKASKNTIHGKSYPSSWQNFDGNPETITRLDSWVFQQFHEWLEDTGAKVKQLDGIILFLHLLGCDTAGHATKPHSREYSNCLIYVDREIERVTKRVDEFFDDKGTAYIFTSDHGMTEWGSHGSGSPDETETPLVVWGSGVNSSRQRVDVEQADIAPLMSSLLGISIPVNNEGVLPRKYLKDGNNKYGASALLSNVRQLELQVRGTRILNYGYGSELHRREIVLYEGIKTAEDLLQMGEVTKSIAEGEKLISFAKESLAYFRGYHRSRLMFYLTVTWLGWIALLFIKMTELPKSKKRSELKLACDIFFVCATILVLISHRGTSGWRLRSYGLLALLSSWMACRSFTSYSYPAVRGGWYWIAGTLLLTTVMSFGLEFRWALGAATLGSCAMQAALFKNADHRLIWTAIILSTFPLLPVVGSQPRIYFVLLALLIGGLTMMVSKHHNIGNLLKIVELVRFGTAALVCLNFVDGRTFISWLILVSTPLCVFAHPVGPKQRIFGVGLAFLPTLALLSVSYEPLFLVALTAHLLSWPLPTATDSNGPVRAGKKTLCVEDYPKAAFFMLYVLLGFFGTGNVASLSSFDPMWTRHFLTVFSPFTMCTLIVLKTAIPLLMVGCAIRTLAPANLFAGTMLLGDCLSLPVMYAVTPQGSWLDIGSAISRFVIAITLPCIMLVLHYISYPLVSCSFRKFGDIHLTTKQRV
ncbi:GPI ethanolamine phosphate transferase 1-like isoform X2 [Athalia rosae]|nr:GPI ethanolamine phosphate transferase 1-like isoform X2 [Athalia rosae]XP_048507583.1 GPI ethanolamine phosphate transferase 1-like isoform X2 [Athalia rosae]